MNKQHWADRFSRDVDRLLVEAGRTDLEPIPTEYRQALDVARILATTDWSAESQVRGTLRRRLLDKIETRGVKSLQKENPMRTIFGKRPVLGLVALGSVALFMITLAWPGALIAAAQGIENVIQSLAVGQHTFIQQVTPERDAPAQQEPPATPVVEQQGDLWIIRTAAGNFSGNALPGREVAVRRVQTLDEAQAGAPFKLHQPEYLPTGYTFHEAILTPLDWVFLFYDGPGGDIVLAQMPVGDQPGGDVVSSGVGTLTEHPIESVTLNGRPAGWVEGNILMWEAEGVSYALGGNKLSLDEAMHIAESVK